MTTSEFTQILTMTNPTVLNGKSSDTDQEPISNEQVNLDESNQIPNGLDSISISISDEKLLLEECARLGEEIRSKQQEFELSVRCTIEKACEIGKIAHKAKETVSKLPTKVQKAKLDGVHISKLNYRKPTFEQWIEENTGLGKTTIYQMIALYEKVQQNPDHSLSDDMGWREALGYFSEKPKIESSDEETEEDANIETGSEREKFNKLYEAIDKACARFLDTTENLEFREFVVRWKNEMSEDVSKANLPYN